MIRAGVPAHQYSSFPLNIISLTLYLVWRVNPYPNAVSLVVTPLFNSDPPAISV